MATKKDKEKQDRELAVAEKVEKGRKKGYITGSDVENMEIQGYGFSVVRIVEVDGILQREFNASLKDINALRVKAQAEILAKKKAEIAEMTKLKAEVEKESNKGK